MVALKFLFTLVIVFVSLSKHANAYEVTWDFDNDLIDIVFKKEEFNEKPWIPASSRNNFKYSLDEAYQTNKIYFALAFENGPKEFKKEAEYKIVKAETLFLMGGSRRLRLHIPELYKYDFGSLTNYQRIYLKSYQSSKRSLIEFLNSKAGPPLLAEIAAFISPPALAENVLYTRGDMSCKQFIDMQTSDQAEADRYVYWLGGVLTGHSIASGKALGKGVNIACVNTYVLDYCKNTVGSPDLSEGMVKLLAELERGDNDYLNSDGCRLN